jgi:hypothetical protein
MRRGVAIAAYQGDARQREALLRPDDMDDAVARIIDFEQLDAEIGTVPSQGIDLKLRVFRNVFIQVGGDIVIDHRQGEFRTPDFPARHAQPFERLRARHLMNDMSVDIEQAGAVLLLIDQMRFPNFIEKRAGRCHVPSSSLK